MSIIHDIFWGIMLFVVIYGYMSYFYSRFHIQVECLPVILFSGIGCLVFLAGILNIMELTFWLIVAIGGFLAVKSIVQKRYLGKSVGVCLLLMLSVYLLFFLSGQKYYHWDNFSHWGLIVKSLWKESRFPNFETSVISFQAYPVGSACFIWFVCKFLGFTEGHAMFAQSMLMLSCAGPLFSFAKNESKIKRLLMTVLAFLGGGFFASYGTELANGMYNAMVDSLLAVVAVAAFAIIFLYKDQMKTAVFCVMPLVVLEVCIKNSGIMWVIAIIIEIVCLAGNQIRKKELLKYILEILAVVGGYLYLWKRHIALVFVQAETTYHSMSINNYKAVFGNKSSEDIQYIRELFLDRCFHKDEPIWWLLIAFLCAVLLVKIFHNDIFKTSKIGFGLLYSAAIILIYQIGNFAMYLFSMSTSEAKVLAGYERYVMTLRLFIWGVMLVMLLQFIKQVNWQKKLSSNWHTILMVVLLFGVIGWCNRQDVKSWVLHPQFVSGREVSRTRLDNMIHMHGLEEDKESMIYVSDTAGGAGGYRYVMSKYLLWPRGLRMVDTENVRALDDFMQYDYLIILESDEAAEEWLVSNGFSADTECIKTADVEYLKASDAIRALSDENYLSIISVSDDASIAFTDELAESMHSIGLQYDLRDCYRQGYIAVIDGGSVVYEALSEERLEYSGDFAGMHCDVISAGYTVGKESSIILDGVEYSNNQRGMNIVIYDKNLQKVVSTTTFDTWARDGHYVAR